jgi:phage terminase large subunit-like protein
MSRYANSWNSALDYIVKVESGQILVSKLVKASIERFKKDLQRKDIYFDAKAAEKACNFFDFLKHYKGKYAGRPFILEGWEAFIIGNIFGWKNSENNLRRFTEAYIEIPKKNGKTFLAAGVALLMLMMDGESGAEIYSAAYAKEQASISFNDAKKIISYSPALKKHLRVFAHQIVFPATNSFYKAVSSDDNTTEGKNSHCIILDEYHVHRSDDLKESLQSGSVSRLQPLLFIITTAGRDLNSPCYQYRKDICIPTITGKLKADSVFSVIYGTDESDDWRDERVWAKANPNYGISVEAARLRETFDKSKESGRKKIEFLTKHLNIWVNQLDTWIDEEVWNLLESVAEVPKGSICYAGLDLASVSDITAFSIYFPDLVPHARFKNYYFVPEEAVNMALRNGVDYQKFIEKGDLIVTPGNVVDYNALKQKVLEINENYDLQFVAYDRWNSTHIVQELNDLLGDVYFLNKYEQKMYKFGQGFSSMSAPTKEFEKQVLSRGFRHDGDLVTKWMLQNVAINTDPAGNIKVSKSDSKGKVDGVVAMVMAMGVYLLAYYEQSKVSDTDGFKYIDFDED